MSADMRPFRIANSRVIRVLVTVAVGLGMGVAVASPAQAAITECGPVNTRNFNLPGKPDITVDVIVCVENNGADYRAAWFNIYWRGPVGSTLFGDRFNFFKADVWLEKAQVIKRTYSCDHTGVINNLDDDADTCLMPFKHGESDGSWTGDGYIYYDIKDDGKDPVVWSLTGSPHVG